MPGKVMPLIILSLMIFASTVEVFERGETYALGDRVSAISAVWGGDLEGDNTPEILVGGVVYATGVSKGVVVVISQSGMSELPTIPNIYRTLLMTVCDATPEEGKEIVVASRGIYVFSDKGKPLKERSTVGDVTALEAVNIKGKTQDEIIYGTSAGDVVYLVNFEPENRFSITGGVKFICHRDASTFYIVTSNSVYCVDVTGKQLWSHTVKGEIKSVAAYDVNNDAKKELVFISGSSISFISYEGGKEIPIVTPPASPLVVLVEDVTADGKPDLITACAGGRIIVYADLKEEVQTLYMGSQEDEVPPLFIADVTRDGKPDLLYGGLAQVVVFRNITPPQALITRGLVLLSQGEDLYKKGDYTGAKAKFEEAEQIFIEVKDRERAARCSTYITEVEKILGDISKAQAALDEGKSLYAEGKYSEAKAVFESALDQYTQLAHLNPAFDSAVKEAQDWIDQCNLGIADTFFSNGNGLIEEKKYDEAIILFQKAEEIYTALGESEKVEECREKVDYINELRLKGQEEEEKRETNLIMYVGAALAVVLVVMAYLATRKKVSVKLERGHVYLLLEPQPRKSLQLVKEYGRLGYDGLILTRSAPDQVRRKKLKKQRILQLSMGSKENTISPDNVVNILLRMKEFMASKKDNILLLDGLDYIIIQNTFEDALSLIQKLAESVTLYRGILLVSLNPKSLDEKQLVLLEGEMELLEL